MSTYPSAKRVAIVTGAARGIGKAIAERLHKDGLALVVCDLKDSISLLESHFSGLSDAIVKECDVTDDDAVKQLVDEAVSTFGHVDVMIANAGIARLETIETSTPQELKTVLDVNVQGVFSSFKYAAQAMKKAGKGGRLIAAASVASKQGAPLHAMYCASKFAIRGLLCCAAAEYGPYGITVNAYAPGLMQTDLLDDMAGVFASKVPNADKSTYEKMALQRTPLGRIGQPHEVAGLVSYLVSEEASFITGQTISIDGGLFMN